MVALNFQPQFAEAVESGRKRQTIRRQARCMAGDKIQLYTGQRTKSCRKLGDAVCTRVRPVRIEATQMFLDGERLLAGNAERDELGDRDNDFARKDGFDGFCELSDWFANRYGLPFEGFVVSWRLEE